MDFSRMVNLDAETIKAMAQVGQDTFLVVVGVALHSFLRDYKMGRDLGVARLDDLVNVPKPHKAYWLSYWLTFVVLISVALRFLVGSRAHVTSVYGGSGSVPLDSYSFTRNIILLVAFGVVLVQAAISKSHRHFMLWMVGFSAAGIMWSLLDGTNWGRWWLCLHLWQVLVTVVCFLIAPSKPGTLVENNHVRRLTVSLSLLAVVYVWLFLADLNAIIHLAASTSKA
jgi:hypothetical protein